MASRIRKKPAPVTPIHNRTNPIPGSWPRLDDEDDDDDDDDGDDMDIDTPASGGPFKAHRVSQTEEIVLEARNIPDYVYDLVDWHRDLLDERNHLRSQRGPSKVSYNFPDWLAEHLRVPPSGSFMGEPGLEFRCLECGRPSDDKGVRCGPMCWYRFRKSMREDEVERRIVIMPSRIPGAGFGAFLGCDSKGPLKKNGQWIAVYLGKLYPESPASAWEESTYVIPLGGMDVGHNREKKKGPTDKRRSTATSSRSRSVAAADTVMAAPVIPSRRVSRSGKRRLQTRHPSAGPLAGEWDFDPGEENVMVDAKDKGNWTRFINSYCVPNLMCCVEQVGKIRAIAFAPLRDIHEGEELSFFYTRAYFEQHGIERCVCPGHPDPYPTIRDVPDIPVTSAPPSPGTLAVLTREILSPVSRLVRSVKGYEEPPETPFRAKRRRVPPPDSPVDVPEVPETPSRNPVAPASPDLNRKRKFTSPNVFGGSASTGGEDRAPVRKRLSPAVYGTRVNLSERDQRGRTRFIAYDSD